MEERLLEAKFNSECKKKMRSSHRLRFCLMWLLSRMRNKYRFDYYRFSFHFVRNSINFFFLHKIFHQICHRFVLLIEQKNLRGSKIELWFLWSTKLHILNVMHNVVAQSLFFSFFTLAAIGFHVIICTSYSISCGWLAFNWTLTCEKKEDTYSLPLQNNVKMRFTAYCVCTVKVFVLF